jgi:hypothetical protein
MSATLSFHHGQPERIVQWTTHQADLELGSVPAKAVLKVIDAPYDGRSISFAKSSATGCVERDSLSVSKSLRVWACQGSIQEPIERFRTAIFCGLLLVTCCTRYFCA